MMLSFAFYRWFLIFVIFSFLGWVTESLWCFAGTKKLVNRGFMSGPWCPIYGCGSVLLLVIAEPFFRYPLLVFLAALVSTTALEYFTGWLMETLFKAKWWDYSHRKFNIKGRICLRNSILFGILGLAVTYLLYPLFDRLLHFLSIPTQIVLALVIGGLFVFDFMRAVSAASMLQEKFASVRKTLVELEEHYRLNTKLGAQELAERIGRIRDAVVKGTQDHNLSALLDNLSTQLFKPGTIGRLLRAFPKLSMPNIPKLNIPHIPNELLALRTELIGALKKRYKKLVKKKPKESDPKDETK